MKSGAKPKGKVKIRWNPEFAYAVGLIVADGCLSKDGRHINLTSIDLDQLRAFNICLGIDEKIRKKYSGEGNEAFCIEFSDVLFYQFLLSIGLMPAKSKVLGEVSIPDQYFRDFLRGYFDGDGCSYSYSDPIFPKSYRFYISFASGSEKYIEWLRNKLEEHMGIKGFINRKKKCTNIQLKYSKQEAVIIAKKMYYRTGIICLRRKRLKIASSLKQIQ